MPVEGSSESWDEGVDGDVDHGFVMVGAGFVVTDAAAVFHKPAECAFDHSTARQHGEFFGVVVAFHDLNSQCQNRFRPFDESPGVAAVGPDQRDGRKAARSAVGSRWAASWSWMQAAAATTTSSGHGVGATHGLRIDDRGCRLPVTSGLHAGTASQCVVDALPRNGFRPPPVNVIDRFRWGEVVR
ncbi:MAG TPA: hypothetical protein VHU91_10315 [Mycobacteriales bacterium]|nr:hypothetical protein [Mycobacteriales bacterium]